MKKINNTLNKIVALNNNDENVAKSAADLFNCLDKKYNKQPKKHNKIQLFDNYLINNFDKLNKKNVKEFVDYLINSDDFQQQLDYFVESYINNKNK